MLDILVVDDDDIVRQSVSEALVSAGHRVAQACDGERAMSLFGAQAFDVAICDVHMPKMDGLTLCRRLRHESPGTALVIMTSYGNVSDAVASLRGGIVDYIAKPFDPDEFAERVLGPIAERLALRKKFEDARSEFVKREAGTSLVGTSLIMRQLREGIALASGSDASVLVTGERGAGKKLVARLIHVESPRREGPFVVVPYAALPGVMLGDDWSESPELGSRPYRDEWFRSALGGTMVLDGVEQLSAEAHGRLLSLLDQSILHARRNRDWQPLGVRVISLATEGARALAPRSVLPDPLRMRLACMHLRVPPMRERDGDLYELVCHILHELTPPARTVPGLSPRAWKAFASHEFRDNVRELVWSLEYVLAQANGKEIDVEHLPEGFAEPQSVGIESDPYRSRAW